MSQTAENEPLTLGARPPVENARRARNTLLRRLIDVVVMPSSRIPPQDRSMAGDVLLEMLFEAEDRERAFCARRLIPTHEAPRRLLRYLAQCRIEVARDLLTDNQSFDDSDLVYILGRTHGEHAIAIANRKTLGPGICDALAGTRNVEAIKLMLNSKRSFLSETCIDDLVEFSRDEPDLCALLVERGELRPNHAMTMFWWSDAATRQHILMRHAADRAELIDICADVFAIAAKEGWSDPVARKTLQLIERRQRNRGALERSPFESLEAALIHAETIGIDRQTAQEIGYLAGLKPVTIAKMLTDPGGETLAVLCKATGLKREYFAKLWSALRRPLELGGGTPNPEYVRVKTLFESLSVAKAQTVLRYWNWSLSSSFHADPGDRELVALGEENTFSSARNTARLVFGK